MHLLFGRNFRHKKREFSLSSYVYAENDWLWKNGFEAEAVQHSHSVVAGRKKPHEKNIPHYECGGGIKILVAGLLTTVQDAGTKGFQKYGISQSGAMDEKSFEFANAICGNPENAACLETTLCGPSIRFVTECDFAITGATFANASLNGIPVTGIFVPSASVTSRSRFL